jgi:hypothetical protein
MILSSEREPLWERVIFTALFFLGARPARMPAGPALELPREVPWPLLRLAAQDWLLASYLLALFVEVCIRRGPRSEQALTWLSIDIVTWIAVLVAVRGRFGERHPTIASVIYRFGLGVPVLGSFLQLQWILPAAGGPPLDADLYALDHRLFGVEPAEAWDRFVSPATTEWFAFFYYGYFFLIAAHVFPMLGFATRTKWLARFSFGFVSIYCFGHFLYTIVPAFGPYQHLGPSFQHSLEGSTWWPLVKRAVESVDGGARTDVFPSLHTAVPTYLSLFSFVHRDRKPFRYTWLPLTLFTTQIVAATMFLRWHYLIDIIGGVTLAVTALLLSGLAVAWDDARQLHGGPPVFPRKRVDSPS